MHQKTATYIFFLALVLIGVLLYKDFGIPSDAIWSREMGLVNLKYIAETFNINAITSRLPSALPNLETYPDGDHGPVFELLAICLEWILELQSDRDIYQYRNLLTYFFGCVGAYAVFAMAKRRFNSWTTGLFGALILICTPRVFWESFYNSKDIVFMSMFAIAMNTLIVTIASNALRHHVIHAIVSALAFDVRVAGIIIPIFSIGFALINIYTAKSDCRKILTNLLCYLSIFLIVSIAFWPWLWINPIDHILNGFESSANFQRLIIWILYRGYYYPTTDLPWHYLPWNIIISIPLIFIILITAGFWAPIARILNLDQRRSVTFQFKQDCIFYLICVVPVLAAIFIQPTLYNGWRHFYFIYPACIMICLHGYFFIRRYFFNYKLIICLFELSVALSITSIVIGVWKNHPFSNNYFNVFAGPNWAHRYSIDYWGISTYQAIKYIVENDPRPEITIKPLQCINADAALVLIPSKDASRVRFIYDDTIADYMLLNYIFLHENQKELWEKIKLQFPIYHELTIANQPILTILRETGKGHPVKSINSTGFRTC